MAVPVSEYEFEASPELEAQDEFQRRRFFGALSNLTRRLLPRQRSLLARVAMSAARQGVRRGFPALRSVGVSLTDDGLDGWMEPAEAEISPIRKIYPDAMMEHLGHA